MWAAYKRDCLGDVKPGLSEIEFQRHTIQYAESVRLTNGELWAVVTDVPIGVAGVHFDGHVAFPHVSWFPEATSRDKLEAGVSFIWELKQEHMVIITGPERFTSYWRHLAKYGLLRAVGKIRDYYGPHIRKHTS